MRYSEFKRKEVINVCNCEKLGCVCDMEFDRCTGKITHIMVPGPCKFFGLFSGDDVIKIDYGCIKQIGPDIILVELSGRT